MLPTNARTFFRNLKKALNLRQNIGIVRSYGCNRDELLSSNFYERLEKLLNIVQKPKYCNGRLGIYFFFLEKSINCFVRVDVHLPVFLPDTGRERKREGPILDSCDRVPGTTTRFIDILLDSPMSLNPSTPVHSRNALNSRHIVRCMRAHTAYIVKSAPQGDCHGGIHLKKTKIKFSYLPCFVRISEVSFATLKTLRIWLRT